MSLYWCYRGDQAGRPWRIEVTRAQSHQEACGVFAVTAPSVYVHDLTTPALVRDCVALARGGRVVLTVDRLPSATDRFR